MTIVRHSHDYSQVYFDDGDSVVLGGDLDEMRCQMDRLEDDGFEKYQAYLDGAALNLEVCQTRSKRNFQASRISSV